MTKSIGQAWDIFIKSKNYVSKDSLKVRWEYDPHWMIEGDDDVIGAYFYVCNCYIEVIDGGYMLTIENNSWVETDIAVLENLLFTEWVLPNQFIDLDTPTKEVA